MVPAYSPAYAGTELHLYTNYISQVQRHRVIRAYKYAIDKQIQMLSTDGTIFRGISKFTS